MWHNPRLMNASANTLYGVVVVVLVAAGLWWLAQLPMFAIRHVQVEAIDPAAPLQHVQSQQVRQAMAQVRGSLFTLDLPQVREVVRTLPWVRDVTVRRVFPNRISLRVEEHRAVANWGNGQLVNTYGELFAANAAEVDDRCVLLDLNGPSGSERKVIRRAIDMERVLSPVGRLARLDYSERDAWRAEMLDGMTLEIGREQTSVSVTQRLERFVLAHQWLKANQSTVPIAVDLRYATGYAYRLPPARRDPNRRDAASAGKSAAPEEAESAAASCLSAMVLRLPPEVS